MGFTIPFIDSIPSKREGRFPTGKMRYFEETFEVGEKVACIGAIQEFMYIADGTTVIGKKMVPLNQELASEEYMERNEWSDWDKRAWEDLTKIPAIIMTDVPKFTMRD